MEIIEATTEPRKINPPARRLGWGCGGDACAGTCLPHRQGPWHASLRAITYYLFGPSVTAFDLRANLPSRRLVERKPDKFPPCQIDTTPEARSYPERTSALKARSCCPMDSWRP